MNYDSSSGSKSKEVKQSEKSLENYDIEEREQYWKQNQKFFAEELARRLSEPNFVSRAMVNFSMANLVGQDQQLQTQLTDDSMVCGSKQENSLPMEA